MVNWFWLFVGPLIYKFNEFEEIPTNLRRKTKLLQNEALAEIHSFLKCRILNVREKQRSI